MKQVYIIGGPNGAGKTTTAMTILPTFLSLNEFINADEIAKGLSPLNPGSMDILAGKIMIQRMRKIITENRSFAFETTCSGHNHLCYLEKCKKQKYKINLIFLWLPNAKMAIQRVNDRVSKGGHSIPKPTIERRFVQGLKHLVKYYLPLSDSALIYDNTADIYFQGTRPVIAKKDKQKVDIVDAEKWQMIESVIQ